MKQINYSFINRDSVTSAQVVDKWLNSIKNDKVSTKHDYLNTEEGKQM